MTCLQYARWARSGHRPSENPRQSEKAPSVGDKRWVDLAQWHSMSLGAKVWILFRPPLSHDEGWEQHPHELEQSAVVECEVVQFADFLPVTPLSEPPFDATNALYCRVRNLGGGLPFTPENWQDFPRLFEMRGWIQVSVLHVITLREIPHHFAEEDEFAEFGQWSNQLSCQSKSLIFEAGSGAEASEWWIRTKAAPSRVVLHALDISRDAAEICNRVFHE